MYTPFNYLPDSSRIWIYTANRALTLSEQDLVQQKLLSFVEEWQSHDIDVKASFLIKEDRFIIIGSDESGHNISGCGIDKSVRQLQELENALNIKLLDKSFVYFELDNEIAGIPLPEIKRQVSIGKIVASTPFYNTVVAEKGQLKAHFKILTRDGWVKKYLSETVLY